MTVPPGEVYQAVESPRGEDAVYKVTDIRMPLPDKDLVKLLGDPRPAVLRTAPAKRGSRESR